MKDILICMDEVVFLSDCKNVGVDTPVNDVFV